jgi:hypothetical protein
MQGARCLLRCARCEHARCVVAQSCRLKMDGSINNRRSLRCWLPAELVSPVLRGREGLMEVARALAALNTLPVEVNWTTALHVHVSINTPKPGNMEAPCYVGGAVSTCRHVCSCRTGLGGRSATSAAALCMTGGTCPGINGRVHVISKAVLETKACRNAGVSLCQAAACHGSAGA